MPTVEERKRIAAARAETVTALNKALKYSHEVQKPTQIAYYRAHLDYLDALLEGKVIDKVPADSAKWDEMNCVIDAKLKACQS